MSPIFRSKTQFLSDNKMSEPPLHVAVYQGDLGRIKELLGLGHSPTFIDDRG